MDTNKGKKEAKLISMDYVSLDHLNKLKQESDKWGKWMAFVLFLPVIYFFAYVIMSITRVGHYATNSVSLFALSSGFIIMPILFVGIIVVMVIVGLKAYKNRMTYRDMYKSYFSNKVISSFLKEYYYDHTMGISRVDLANTTMVRFGNRYHAEDYVSGKYKDVGFAQSDVLIQNETKDSDGDSHIETYFSGRCMVFEFPRSFVTRLAVVGSGCREAIYAKELEKFATESGDFNKMFKVYMRDGVEMFYILDPVMIEDMQALGEKHHGNVAFLFVDKKLFICLNDGGDSFEPPKGKKSVLNEDEEIKRLSSEFRTVFDFIDTLELNKKIFK